MKLSFKTKVAYAFASIGDASLYGITGMFLLFFLTTVAGVSPMAAGAIAGLGAVWESICSPVVGYLSDKTESKYGKRKPYILAAAFPLAVVTSLLFTAIDAPYMIKILYYGLMTVLFWTGFAAFFVPYLTWGAELTQDYNERTALRSYSYVFGNAGTALGTVLPTILVDYLMNMGKTGAESWHAAATLIGGCAFVSLFVGTIVVKDSDELRHRREGFKKPERKRNRLGLSVVKVMLLEYWQVLHLRSIRLLLMTSVFFLIGYAIITADRMYFLTFNMNLPASAITFVMLLVTLAGIAFVPFIAALSKKFDKRRVFMLSVTCCVAMMCFYRAAGIDSLSSVCLFSIAVALGNTAYWQLMPSMLYDVCEVDQLIYNKQRAGVIVSLQALSESLSQGVGLQVLGIILELTSFDGEALQQPHIALTWVENSFTIIPAIMLCVALVAIYKYPVTKQRFAKIIEALGDREKGIEVDMEAFKDLK